MVHALSLLWIPWLYPLYWASLVAQVVKNLPVNAGDMGSISGLGRSPGEGNGNLLQYSCLGNPIDRGAWQATIHGVTRVGPNLVTNTYHKRLSDLSLVVLGFPGS